MKSESTSGRVPKYSLHKASGRAVVRLSGRDHYLGQHGSADSYEVYHRVIAEWMARQKSKQGEKNNRLGSGQATSIAALLIRYREFAKTYYSKDGKPTKEFVNLKYAMKPLRELYGNENASDFGPLKLKALQQHFILKGICRTQINKRIDKIRRMFKWAVGEELVNPSTHHALLAVPGLRYGRSTAKEAPPVEPISDYWIEETLPELSPVIAAMVRVQRLTGMRPQDVVGMRKDEIDTSGDVWLYERQEHKNKWRGHKRVIALGPKAIEILKPFIDNCPKSGFLFSPSHAEEIRNAKRRQNRKTPMTPSQAARKRKPKPLRAKRESYDVDSYRRAIKYGIKRANLKRKDDDQIPNWYPLQIRHTSATEIRKVAGLEAAQVILGHARADVTQIYAEKNQQLAVEMARKLG